MNSRVLFYLHLVFLRRAITFLSSFVRRTIEFKWIEDYFEVRFKYQKRGLNGELIPRFQYPLWSWSLSSITSQNAIHWNSGDLCYRFANLTGAPQISKSH